jgi:peptide deformylase
MIYPIVVYGDPVLRMKAKKIEVGSDIKTLAADMFETMYQANGVGLAAPQIGKSLRIFVIDGEPMGEKELEGFKKIFANPELIEEDGKPWVFEEGCLSIPQIRGEVERRGKIRLKYYDENWNLKEENFQGLQARIIQHEIDHIEGILFTDHLGPLKRRMLKNKLSDISKGKVKMEYSMKFSFRA